MDPSVCYAAAGALIHGRIPNSGAVFLHACDEVGVDAGYGSSGLRVRAPLVQLVGIEHIAPSTRPVL